MEKRHSHRGSKEPSHGAKEAVRPIGGVAYLADLVCCQHDHIGAFMKALGSSEVANALLSPINEGVRSETRGQSALLGSSQPF